MPFYQGNKVGVMVYMKKETFEAIEKMRGEYISASAQCATIIEKVIAAGE